MIETIIAMSGFVTSIGIGAGVYYKLGRIEQKLNFLYDNIDMQVTFKKCNIGKEVDRNGIDRRDIHGRN